MLPAQGNLFACHFDSANSCFIAKQIKKCKMWNLCASEMMMVCRRMVHPVCIIPHIISYISVFGPVYKLSHTVISLHQSASSPAAWLLLLLFLPENGQASGTTLIPSLHPTSNFYWRHVNFIFVALVKHFFFSLFYFYKNSIKLGDIRMWFEITVIS